MRAQFDQKLLSSFYLWFDDRVVRYGEAVESGISQTFYYSNNNVDLGADQVAYYSPDRQFVSLGYNVPSGVYIKGGDFGEDYVFAHQQPNTSTGLMIDHDQGRVILNSSMGTGLSISGNFSRKTLNTYITNESEEELLLNTDFLLADQDDQTFLESITGFSSLNYTLPAAFISYNSSNNVPFAFGGMQDTKSNIRAVIIANDNYVLDSTLSLFRDSCETCVPILDYAEFPFGEHFHLKQPPYVYENIYKQKMAVRAQYAFIDKVNVSKLYDTSSSALNLPRNMRIGFVDFSISTPRMPKLEMGEPTLGAPPEPLPPLDEVQLTITGPKPDVFFLSPEFLPENRGFSDWNIKDNADLASTHLSWFFDDNTSQRPDAITSTAGMRLAMFYKISENEIFCKMEKDFNMWDLDESMTITFTIQYF